MDEEEKALWRWHLGPMLKNFFVRNLQIFCIKLESLYVASFTTLV